MSRKDPEDKHITQYGCLERRVDVPPGTKEVYEMEVIVSRVSLTREVGGVYFGSLMYGKGGRRVGSQIFETWQVDELLKMWPFRVSNRVVKWK